MKVRLKETCLVQKLVTPYGVITHAWTEIRDVDYVYNEMEVYQDPKTEPEVKVVEEPKVKDTVEEPKVTVIEEDVKIVEEPEPKPEPKVKKKGKRKR